MARWVVRGTGHGVTCLGRAAPSASLAPRAPERAWRACKQCKRTLAGSDASGVSTPTEDREVNGGLMASCRFETILWDATQWT